MTKHNRLRALNSLYLILLCICCNVAQADKAALEAELQGYIDTYKNGTFLAKKKTASIVRWKGYSDERFWDLVAKDLEYSLAKLAKAEPQLARFKTSASRSSREFKRLKHTLLELTERPAFYIRWLGVSGNNKYASTLASISYFNQMGQPLKYAKKLDSFRDKALEALPTRVKQVAIITKGLENTPAEQQQRQRIINMIQSDDMHLIEYASKQISKNHINDIQLVDIAHEQLLEIHPRIKSSLGVRALDNILEAMTFIGKKEFRNTTASLANSSKSPKVRKYANKYLKFYDVASPNYGLATTLTEDGKTGEASDTQ